METLSFVIVGHVDHGKSTLIGRLLYDTNSLSPDKIEEIKTASQGLGKETEFAYLLDHLEEERQQGITIDTTQVFFKTHRRQYVIIDAPGHREFVKNMVTGASQAEAAVLIIDVNEGVQEQSRRHAYILSLLGIKQIIVVLNKMDIVGFSKEKFEEVKKHIANFLAEIGISPLLYIPISAFYGDNIASKSTNMSWYQGPTFLEALDKLTVRQLPEEKSLIFPVQDIYKIDTKRIAVGRIESGKIRKGDKIKVLPEGSTTVISSIEKYLSNVTVSLAGESIGVTTADPIFVNRGDIICSETNPPHLTDTFGATIFWMSHKPWDVKDRLTIKCATQEMVCKITKVEKRIDSSTLELISDTSTIANLDVAEVTIKTKKPIAVKTFGDVQELGRFVLVRDENTCAGGIVIDINGGVGN